MSGSSPTWRQGPPVTLGREVQCRASELIVAGRPPAIGSRTNSTYRKPLSSTRPKGGTRGGRPMRQACSIAEEGSRGGRRGYDPPKGTPRELEHVVNAIRHVSGQLWSRDGPRKGVGELQGACHRRPPPPCAVLCSLLARWRGRIPTSHSETHAMDSLDEMSRVGMPARRARCTLQHAASVHKPLVGLRNGCPYVFVLRPLSRII